MTDEPRELAPARWHAHHRPGDTGDVLVPVTRSEPPDDVLTFRPGRIAALLDAPGDRPAPPCTVAAARDWTTTWDGRKTGRTTVVVPILRVTADDWHTLHTLARQGIARAVTDLHTGVAWQITEWAPMFGSGPTATADPVEPYTVRLPPPWGRGRYDDTYTTLDRLTGRDTLHATRLAAVYPLAGWTVVGPYREDRP